ncbi:hypothetical protein BJ912DRAFT_960424 [Pholiota molesta]|nr:hypothetical protein BJ912DRAFT_960424 [Pholiota molesta]
MHISTVSGNENGFERARGGSGEPASDIPTLGFPESFQRTAPPGQEEDITSDDLSDSTSLLEVNSLNFPRGSSVEAAQDEHATPRRISRSSIMRLENILNDVSIDSNPRPRSRSLGRSPVQSQFQTHKSLPHPSNLVTRSQSPDENVVKKKKVKLHRCPECQKAFPRPSGLRTHMNIHTKEKPFNCEYPGCERSFSVVSNAKRHMRTHGIGIIPHDNDSASTPYVVGFEEPVVVSPQDNGDPSNRNPPVRLRWVPSAAEGRRASVDGSYTGPDLHFIDSEMLNNSALAVQQA